VRILVRQTGVDTFRTDKTHVYSVYSIYILVARYRIVFQ